MPHCDAIPRLGEATRWRRPPVTGKLVRVTTPEWITTKEAADILGVGLRAVYRAAAGGDLRARRAGHRILVSAEDVERHRRDGTDEGGSRVREPRRPGPSSGDGRAVLPEPRA